MLGRFVSTDSNITYGISIVGQAQAGKSELARITTEAWSELYPHTEAFHFKSGAGFRSIAAEVMRCGFDNYDYDKKVTESQFLRDVNRFVRDCGTVTLERIIGNAYGGSLRSDKLGSVAVTSAVSYISEHPYFRPRLNEAAGNRLKDILINPRKENLTEKPSVVVFDGRNKDECNEVLSRAGVIVLGTFVMTCPEDVIVTRKMAKDPEVDAVTEEQRLRERNIADRRRGLGPTTLPRDLKHSINLDELLDLPNEHLWLAHAGRAITQDPENAGIIFRTDRLTPGDEHRALPSIIRGMFPE